MLNDVRRLPRVADPDISYCSRGQVTVVLEQLLWQLALLLFLLVLLFVSLAPHTICLYDPPEELTCSTKIENVVSP